MSQYKLVYFNIPGLAESIRLLLSYVNQPFKDVRLTSEEFNEEKPSNYYFLYLNKC